MKPVNTKDAKFYLSELKSGECFCGKNKRSGYSFCYHCFQSLPQDIRNGLYRKIWNGYPEAYDQAVGYLEQNVL